jgi:hypothetical protein
MEGDVANCAENQGAGEEETGGTATPMASTPSRELTFGEKAVGLTFNPSGDPKVQEIKEAYAKIIDLPDGLRAEAGIGGKGRLLSTAITEAQGAQMWAVKGITWKD